MKRGQLHRGARRFDRRRECLRRGHARCRGRRSGSRYDGAGQRDDPTHPVTREDTAATPCAASPGDATRHGPLHGDVAARPTQRRHAAVAVDLLAETRDVRTHAAGGRLGHDASQMQAKPKLILRLANWISY